MSSSRKQPWQYRGVARRIGDEALVAPTPMAQQVVDIDVDMSDGVVEATTADVANLQMVAASWLHGRTLEEDVAEAVERFVFDATIAISGGGAIVCAEAHSLSEEWQRLKKLVNGFDKDGYIADGNASLDKEGDTADEMQDKEGDAADENADIGATRQTAQHAYDEKANERRLEAKKQSLHADHGGGDQVGQRNRRAIRRETKKVEDKKKDVKREVSEVVSAATKRFRGSTESEPFWNMMVNGSNMDEVAVDID